MASTYTTSLRIEKPGTGEQSGTWGTTVNTSYDLMEKAVAGYLSIAMGDANVTLTTANGSSDQARNAVIELTGTNTATRQCIVPAVSKVYVIKNSTTQSVTVKTSGGTGPTILSGKASVVYCDGTNVNSVAVSETTGLAALSGVTPATDTLPYFTSSSAATVTSLTSFARTILDDADAATARATLGVTIGTNVQAYSAVLGTLSTVSPAADALPYFTGTSTASVTTLTAFARTLLDDPDAATARATLGVTAGGTALQAANNLSDVASVSTSRTNLGLGTAATQNTGTSGANVPLLNGANTHSGQNIFNSTQTTIPASGAAGNAFQVSNGDGSYGVLIGSRAADGVGWIQAQRVDATATTYALNLNPNGGAVQIGGVAVPTISSTDTLSNKTLSSPTLSGTVAGSPTFSGNIILSGVPTFIASFTQFYHRAGASNFAGHAFANSSGVARWADVIESDGNGQQRILYRYDTSGVYAGTTYAIDPATGVITFEAIPVAAGAAVVNLSATQTLSNKTLSSPTISGTVVGAPTFSGAVNFSSDSVMFSAQSGNEGGQFLMQRPATGTTLGGAIYIDVFQDLLRIFDPTGSAKGFAFNLAGASASAATQVVGHDMTQTLSNKTLSSPTISGTVAGSPTMTGTWTFPEGGFRIKKPASGSTLAGDLIFDISGDILRIYESASPFKGFNINIAAMGSQSEAATIATTQTFTNKTLSSPTISGTVAGTPTFSGVVGFDGAVSIKNGSGTIKGFIGIGAQVDGGSGTDAVLRGEDGISFSIAGSRYARLTSSNFNSVVGITVNSVSVPTISSTDTLTNKTLSSPTISGTVAGSPTFSGATTFSATGAAVTINNAEPRMDFYQTDAGADAKRWAFIADGNNFYLQTRTDADAFGANVISIVRSGTTGSSVSVTASSLNFTGVSTFQQATDTIVTSQGGAGYGAFYARGSGTNNSYVFFGNSTNSERSRISVDDSRNFVISNNGGSTNHFQVGPTGAILASGVAIPTVSSTDTLTNKTLTSPTINGGTIQSRVQTSSETTGTLTSASANKHLALTGNITLNNSVFTADDKMTFDPGTSARTITRGAGCTMYVNGVDSATATIAANQMAGVHVRSASVFVLTGAVS